MNLANRVAIITGASSGIGEALARLFVAEGARVALAGEDAIAVVGWLYLPTRASGPEPWRRPSAEPWPHGPRRHPVRAPHRGPGQGPGQLC